MDSEDDNGEIDLSAYSDLESGVDREKRLEREWLMSGGEEDLNDNGISDELEREHEALRKPKRTTVRGLIRRMVEEAEEDWDEHGNKPLPGSARKKEDPEAEEQSGDASEAAPETEEKQPETTSETASDPEE